jgi:hypothetical protein
MLNPSLTFSLLKLHRQGRALESQPRIPALCGRAVAAAWATQGGHTRTIACRSIPMKSGV